jgi:hypothetical protein
MTVQKDANSPKTVAGDKADERKQRQAAQLRANLQRRKEQIRQRDSSEEPAD